MGVDLAQPLDRRAGEAEEPVLHSHRDLGEQVELVFRQRVVALADRPGDRVVDRQQAEVGTSREDGVGDAPVRGAAERDEPHAAPGRVSLEDRVRIRAFDPLEGRGHRQRGGHRRGVGLLVGRGRDGHGAPIFKRRAPRVGEGLLQFGPSGLISAKDLPRRGAVRSGVKKAVKPSRGGHVGPILPRPGRRRQPAVVIGDDILD